jgi:hypothetical protein
MIGEFLDTAIVVVMSVLIIAPTSLAVLRSLEDRLRHAATLRALESQSTPQRPGSR